MDGDEDVCVWMVQFEQHRNVLIQLEGCERERDAGSLSPESC